MSGVNVQVSVTNVPQFDRHQSEAHRAPVTNQEQNAQIAREDVARRIQMPVQPDAAEGKVVDPREKQQEKQQKRKRNRNKPQETGPLDGPVSDSGSIVDIEA